MLLNVLNGIVSNVINVVGLILVDEPGVVLPSITLISDHLKKTDLIIVKEFETFSI